MWYVLTDTTVFAGELGFAMEVPLCSHANVREVLELLEVVYATEFTKLPEQWRDLQSRAIDYHPLQTRRGGDYVFYDPWRGHIIDESSTRMRSDATRVIPDNLECGWVHPEDDIERTLRDDTSDYHLIYGMLHSQSHTWETAAGVQNPVTDDEEIAGPSSRAPVVTDDTVVVRRFLEDAEVIGNEENPMTLSEMKAYVG